MLFNKKTRNKLIDNKKQDLIHQKIQKGKPISKKEMAEVFNQTATLKITPQSGKSKNPFKDSSRKALPPGKRVSKTGKIYWETRPNRSDKKNKI